MHFWIDKRSQACGFGRARVAASLSGAGLGIGHHHPRRLRGKSMVTPIHRFQNAECRAYGPRHHHHQQHNNHHQQQQPQHSTQHNHHHHQQSAQHYTNNQQLQQQQIQQQLHQQQLLLQQQQQQQQQQQHLEQQQYQQNLYETHYQNQSHQQNLQTFQTNYQQQPQQQHQQTHCQVPSSLSHQYGGPSHPIELEQGSMGISANLLNTNQQILNGPPNPDAQLLPTHLKCGIWASLALATVFVAGAKFYFDHQGTGLEVLIFCAFSATFFLAACTVSLCKRPRDLNILPSITHDHVQNIDNTAIQVNHDMITATISETAITSTNITSTTNSSLSTIAPPPPYHIAILLPETSKNPDETPPPSYDKILI